MSLDQVGAYTLLLCHNWLEGSIPSDPILLARLCHSDLARFESEIWPGVAPCFRENGHGALYNPRLRKERARQVARKKAKSEAGKRGAKVRWEKDLDGSAIAVPLANDSSSSSSPSSSPSATKKKTPSKKKAARTPTLQQRRVERVLEVLPSCPPPRAAKLLKQWERQGDDACIEALKACVDHYPAQGYGYVLQVMQSALRNGGAVPNGKTKTPELPIGTTPDRVAFFEAMDNE